MILKKVNLLKSPKVCPQASPCSVRPGQALEGVDRLLHDLEGLGQASVGVILMYRNVHIEEGTQTNAKVHHIVSVLKPTCSRGVRELFRVKTTQLV
jgi:hypothetical protein